MTFTEKSKAKVAPGTLTQKYVWSFIAGCVLIDIFLSNFLVKLIKLFPADTKNLSYMIDILPRAVSGIFFVVLAIYLGLLSKKDFGSKGFGKGLLFGIPYLLFPAFVGNAITLLVSGRLRDDTTFLTICLFSLSYLMIGFVEEVIFRGVIFNALKNKYGDSGQGLFGAVLLSSAVFGLSHFMNFIYGAPLAPTLMQVLTTALTGVLLCAIYIRSGNLLAVIVFHALIDLILNFKGILTLTDIPVPTQTEPPELSILIGAAVFSIVIEVIFVLYGLFLIRKQLKKKKEIL